jgi:alpha-galactosidase
MAAPILEYVGILIALRNTAMNLLRLVRTASITLAVVSICADVWAVTVAPADLQRNSQWVAQNLLGNVQPFSFTYNGQSSSALLPTWSKTTQTTQLDASRTQYTLTWTDPSNSLQVKCSAVQYSDYPVVEWTTDLRNIGATTLPLIQNVQGINTSWTRSSSDSEFVVNGIVGDTASINSYKPYQNTLTPNTSKFMSSTNGRSSDGSFPYYSLSVPGGGVSIAVGWPGQWSSTLVRDSGTNLRVQAGQQNLSVQLNAGESLSTPLTAMCSWTGSDTVRAQNIWRQWMLKYNEPGSNGNPMAPGLSGHTNGFYSGMVDTATDEIRDATAYLNGGASYDYWWLDAGWYPCGSDWGKVGTWKPDPTRFPNGLRQVSDFAHNNEMKFVTWFEPERVSAGTEIATQHPGWVIGGVNGGLLNMGNPAARAWITDRIDSLITQQGIDVYRQDFNIAPLSYWQSLDTTNRTGMTENQYIQGYLAYLDELRRRHPEIAMDNCASGGRRNDLASLRRMTPLLRSDYAFDATANQCQTYGLAGWIPYAGTQAVVGNDWGRVDNYNVRSAWSPFMVIVCQKTTLDSGAVNWPQYNRMLDEQRTVAPLMLGDFYPLTPYSQAENVWMAWQFDRPDLHEGMVQAFRRSNSLDSTLLVFLYGLDPTTLYELTDLDSHEVEMMLGADLMTDGMRLEIDQQYCSQVILYQAVPEPSILLLAIVGLAGLLGTYAWRKSSARTDRP